MYGGRQWFRNVSRIRCARRWAPRRSQLARTSTSAPERSPRTRVKACSPSRLIDSDLVVRSILPPAASAGGIRTGGPGQPVVGVRRVLEPDERHATSDGEDDRRHRQRKLDSPIFPWYELRPERHETGRPGRGLRTDRWSLGGALLRPPPPPPPPPPPRE
jgi:hypothetical protein